MSPAARVTRANRLSGRARIANRGDVVDDVEVGQLLHLRHVDTVVPQGL